LASHSPHKQASNQVLNTSHLFHHKLPHLLTALAQTLAWLQAQWWVLLLEVHW
jgi:hypothetical protein